MDFLPEHIERYAAAHSSAEPSILKKLYRETWQKVVMPRMLSGHLQGRALSMFSRMIRPDRVLEIGSYTGYSALCFAEGLSDRGQIDAIEINEELNPIQDKYWNEAGISERIHRYNAPALEVLPTLDGPYDIIFIDADKENYPAYYDLCLPLLSDRGIMLIDNVLWTGKVTEEVSKHDPETKALQALNDRIQDDAAVFNVLLPIRDGIMMVMKA